jgi:hypothetical protein
MTLNARNPYEFKCVSAHITAVREVRYISSKTLSSLCTHNVSHLNCSMSVWNATTNPRMKIIAKTSDSSMALLATWFILFSCLAYYSTFKMEVTCSAGTSVDFQRTTRRFIPEDGTLRFIHIYLNCKWVLPGGSGATVRPNTQITHHTQTKHSIQNNKGHNTHYEYNHNKYNYNYNEIILKNKYTVH